MFQGVYNVYGGDGFFFGVFGVGDGVMDYVFEEYFQYVFGFFVDQIGDMFYFIFVSEMMDGGFCDILDVIMKYFFVMFGFFFFQIFFFFIVIGYVD